MGSPCSRTWCRRSSPRCPWSIRCPSRRRFRERAEERARRWVLLSGADLVYENVCVALSALGALSCVYNLWMCDVLELRCCALVFRGREVPCAPSRRACPCAACVLATKTVDAARGVDFLPH